MRRWLASILCPELAQAEHEAARLRLKLDEAEQWLGSDAPEAASLAAYILNGDRWYWSSTDRPHRFPWSPPKWVTTIGAYREWLRSKPFAHPRPKENDRG